MAWRPGPVSGEWLESSEAPEKSLGVETRPTRLPVPRFTPGTCLIVSVIGITILEITAFLSPGSAWFLPEHHPAERNPSRKPANSMTWQTPPLLLAPTGGPSHKAIDPLTVEIGRPLVVWPSWKSSRRSGNAAPLRPTMPGRSAFPVRFVAANSPELVTWCGRIRAHPLQQVLPPLVTYL